MGRRTGRSLYPKDASEGGWCRLQDCIYLTAWPESSKNTHPGTGTASGGRKNLSRKNLGAWSQAGREGNRNLVVAIPQDQSYSCRGRDFRGTKAVLHCSASLLGSTNAALLSDVEITQTVAKPSQPPDGWLTISILLSSKLGSSALSLPEMLFRMWGGSWIGRYLYPKAVSEGGWCRLHQPHSPTWVV